MCVTFSIITTSYRHHSCNSPATSDDPTLNFCLPFRTFPCHLHLDPPNCRQYFKKKKTKKKERKAKITLPTVACAILATPCQGALHYFYAPLGGSESILHPRRFTLTPNINYLCCLHSPTERGLNIIKYNKIKYFEHPSISYLFDASRPSLQGEWCFLDQKGAPLKMWSFGPDLHQRRISQFEQKNQAKFTGPVPQVL